MKHVSYSAIKTYTDCPWKFKLLYLDKVEVYPGNALTAFGTAVHKVLEHKITKKKIKNFTTWDDHFDKCFMNSIKECYDRKSEKFKPEFVHELRHQGKELIPYVLPSLEEKFGKFEIIGSEFQLYEDIDFPEDQFKFKGFVDLIIKTEGGKYHIIDFKTTSFWDEKQKNDKNILYQLIYYKYFLSRKLKVEDQDIDVHFILLKRTSKSEKKIEFLDVTSGKIRTHNALDLLNQLLANWKKNNFPKNRLSCEKCQFKDKHDLCSK